MERRSYARHTGKCPPDPIVRSYVINAGMLWRRGERYTYDERIGAQPRRWVPADV